MKEGENDLSANSTKDSQYQEKKRDMNMTEKYGVSSRNNFVPLPEYARCGVCGRHISELKPFGGPDDPLEGDYNGACLVRCIRGFSLYEGDEPTYGSSWECRDCILLDGDDFYERLSQRKAQVDLEKADAECRESSEAPGKE